VLKLFADLTKFGIVVFSVLAGLAGYATGFQNEDSFDWKIFLKVILGIYFLSSGCLALNQVQDAKLDAKMPRTILRPIPSGKIKPAAAAILAVLFTLVGLQLLFEVQVVAGWVGLLSVFLYNGPYTLYLKRKWAYAAVPGAIPGALPVTIGYAAANPDIFNSESIYLFLIMFLWQMPHFWVLAIRYKDDYAAGGIPTLPVAKGLDVTLYQIVMYTFAYVGVALAAPLFVHVNWLYILLTLPLVFKIIQELIRYYKSKGEQRWLAFFMWLNVSMLIFILIPVIDKWNFLFLGRG
jgi:protoheme IX farnesyltransferase